MQKTARGKAALELNVELLRLLVARPLALNRSETRLNRRKPRESRYPNDDEA